MLFSRKRNRIRIFAGLLAFLVFFMQLPFALPTRAQAAAETLKVYPTLPGVTLSTAYAVEVK